MAAPPAACTLTIQTPRRTAAATAPATVFGNVVELQVEEDAIAAGDELLDDGRSVAREQPAADLEAADRSTERIGQCACFSGRIDVEGD